MRFRLAALFAMLVAVTVLAAPAFADHGAHGGGFHGGVHVFVGPHVYHPYYYPGFRGFVGVAPYGYWYGPPPVVSYYWYCPDPPGYYPSVEQCFAPWQPVPG